MPIDIDNWMNELIVKLTAAFGDRLILVGVQGSRARGEAREASDIDAVVIIEGLSAADLETYREVIASMPSADLACGFVGSPDVLAAWPRHDAFNLVQDTKVLFGSFDFMDTEFSSEDAVLSAKVGASEIYHALCHTLAFEPETLPAVVDVCVKNAFFVARALAFAKSGEPLLSRSDLVKVADDKVKDFLDAYDYPEHFDFGVLARELVVWCARVMEQQ